MADGIQYQVAAVMIVAKVPGAQGGEAYFKRGRLLPASVRKSEVQRLLDLGLIEEAPAEPATTVVTSTPPPAAPTGSPDAKWTVEQIDAYAAEHAVDLTGMATKPEKLAAIAAASNS